MKIFFAFAASAVLVFSIAGAFSTTADAGFSRRAQMNGTDATYRSTGHCQAGTCKKTSKPHH